MKTQANTNTNSIRTKQLVLFAMFSAIIIFLSATPIGFIHLGVIKATIVHVPVIIGSIVLGPKIGAGLGGMFGATSLISNTIFPSISSFVFSPFIPIPGLPHGSLWALVICFIPRILVGIVPWYMYRLLKGLVKDNKFNFIVLAISGVTGSLTNTLLVMNLIYILFKEEYAAVRGVAQDAVYGIITAIIVSNGVPEAFIAGILTAFIGRTLFVALRKER